MLDERKRKILQAIIEDYIATAEPVGSRALSKSHGLGISAATIRNEMSDLESLGFIAQPHTSAGRIPSAKGYRFYVDQLLPRKKLGAQEIKFIEQWYDERVHQIEGAFSETARLLSRMTSNLVVVTNQEIPSFRYLQFLPYDDKKAILVLVADSGVVENHLMPIPAGLKFDDLQQISQVINHRLAGRSVSELPKDILDEINDSIVQDIDIFKSSMKDLQQTLQTSKEQKVYLGGASQLVEQPEFREDLGRVRNLLGLLEEERGLFDILAQDKNENLTVTIGQENSNSQVQDYSIVQGTYQFGDQIVGKIAIIGPTRMEYQKVVSIMEYMQKQMSQMLTRYIDK